MFLLNKNVPASMVFIADFCSSGKGSKKRVSDKQLWKSDPNIFK